MTINKKGGFTLLEVLLSSLIFTIVILTVLGTYSMLMTNYRQARHYIESTGRAHNIFGHFQRNLVNVYPKYENEQKEMMDMLFRYIEVDYNIPRTEIREDFIWDLKNSQQYEEESVYGFANRSFGDFSFVLDKHKNNALFSFTVYNKAFTTPLELGLHRLTYFVEDNILYCYKQPVFIPFKDVVKQHYRETTELESGKLLPLADGILDFHVEAHYYKDYEFSQTESWDSHAHKHVFPPFSEEEMMEMEPEDERLLFPERDGHPAGVSVTVRISMDPRDTRGRKHKTYYNIPVSISTWFEDEYRYEYRYETPYR